MNAVFISQINLKNVSHDSGIFYDNAGSQTKKFHAQAQKNLFKEKTKVVELYI